MLDAPARRPEFFLTADEPSQSRTLRCDPMSVAVARRLVVAVLGRWELSEDLAERAELVVSELATNAIVHARTCGAPIRVAITRGEDDHIQVAVTDLDRRPLGPARTDPYAEGGRGLDLVAALSVRWGCERRRWGKRVWAELA
ncbi:ATP-binding protein [Streptomyces sp. R302]|uniref:ATP-binding protein n=1 Tax=unclassified Streptomyces TaxID=2593676 RepID=UPI00145E2E3E|nr:MULTISPECIES: ATP-binding protein [unclassified Streptomyces]NML55372.1 ATP-binding protein [Streptomyces sp. R301]NML80244.1 ATP-binding protein [Streptomyces sp. R302]